MFDKICGSLFILLVVGVTVLAYNIEPMILVVVLLLILICGLPSAIAEQEKLLFVQKQEDGK